MREANLVHNVRLHVSLRNYWWVHYPWLITSPTAILGAERRELAMSPQLRVCIQRAMVYVNDGRGYAYRSSCAILSIRSTFSPAL